MRYVPTVNDNSLKGGLKASAALHFAAFLFMFFGLPHLIPPLPSHHQPVPFDIVTIGDITNTRVDDNPQEQNQPPAAQPKPQPPTPQPTPPQPVVQEKPQPPAPKVESKAEDIGEALKPKPVEKPKPPTPEKPAAAQPQQDLLASVLKNVAKMKPAEAPANPNAVTSPDAKASAGSGLGPALSSRLTITEEDLLRRQIEQCWNPPVGARNAESLVVEVIIDVNPDRTVANAEIVDKMRYATDSFFRAAADSAIRAVRNPKCNPLELAPDKYEQWKRIDFTFDPRDML